MSATEDDGVAPGLEQRRDVPLQQLAQGRAAQVAGFDQLHQPRTRLGDHPHIAGKAVQQRGELGALQRARGGEHPHPAAGRGRSRFDGRLHANEGPMRIINTQVRHRGHRCRIAGQHEGLGALLAEKLRDHRANARE
jgi:hypothetical protein